MRESAAAAAESDTDPASPWYALARTALGAALYLSGEFDAAFAQLSDAMQGDASLAVVRLLACSVMALVAIERGRLGQAQELVAAARAIAATAISAMLRVAPSRTRPLARSTRCKGISSRRAVISNVRCAPGGAVPG